MQFLSIPDCLASGVFPDLPPTTRWRTGCRGGTPSLPKSPSLRYPPGRKSQHDVSEVGASGMAQTVPPFWGVMVTGGIKRGGWLRGRVLGGGGAAPWVRIKADEWLHFSILRKSITQLPCLFGPQTHLPQIGQHICRF